LRQVGVIARRRQTDVGEHRRRMAGCAASSIDCCSSTRMGDTARPTPMAPSRKPVSLIAASDSTMGRRTSPPVPAPRRAAQHRCPGTSPNDRGCASSGRSGTARNPTARQSTHVNPQPPTVVQ
jgi:hypothetical protein